MQFLKEVLPPPPHGSLDPALLSLYIDVCAHNYVPVKTNYQYHKLVGCGCFFSYPPSPSFLYAPLHHNLNYPPISPHPPHPFPPTPPSLFLFLLSYPPLPPPPLFFPSKNPLPLLISPSPSPTPLPFFLFFLQISFLLPYFSHPFFLLPTSSCRVRKELGLCCRKIVYVNSVKCR